MSRIVKRSVFALLLAVVMAAMTVVSAFSETINMRSGGGYAYGQNDPAWTYLAGSPGAALSASPFTAADFAAAYSGPLSVVVPPYGSFWLSSLACDPLAQWISVDASAGPATALYCQAFNVHSCCIAKATLTFCWASDDNIGDQLYGGPNPMGVYLNGVALPITGGSYATENTATVDVTSLLHCSQNQIFVYNRDAAYVVTGVMFSIHIDIAECPLKTEPSTWGKVKALYR
ncbi:MAG TPA: hypothetical protein VJS69_04030 [Candidatus Krumholzibacteria bacterium]|nr:hypothetical protein [Candidatus Krumholzibacteria bacterium]